MVRTIAAAFGSCGPALDIDNYADFLVLDPYFLVLDPYHFVLGAKASVLCPRFRRRRWTLRI